MNDEQPCSTCNACCIYLGITALKKYSGQICRHLNGANPEAQCTIYARRPAACSRYQCFWKMSDLPIEYRPNNNGLLVTPYTDGITIIITDVEKAGDIQDINSNLNKMLAILFDQTQLPNLQVRIWNYANGRTLLFKDGKLWIGQILPQEKRDYEGLSFEIEEKPIAAFRMGERP